MRAAGRRELRGLYLVLDTAELLLERALDIASAALAGGARVVQLRDKRRDKGLQLEYALALRKLCTERRALFIINDHADLAMAAGADGAHVGQTDLPVAAVRRMLGAGALVGCSTHDVEEAREAVRAGADYVALGSIFPTRSKHDARPASFATLERVRAAVEVPLVAIGGIAANNVATVLAVGVDMVAVGRGIVCAADVRAAAAAITAAFEREPAGS